MAEIGYSIAVTLIETLAHETIKKICELWGYKSELENLKQTVTFVEKVLLDADSKWDQLSHQDQHFISELKDVVYDADDVFDEFRTLAELNQLGKLKKGGYYFDRLHRFFSSDQNQVGQAYRMYCQVKDVKKRLDIIIAANHTKFELKVDGKYIELNVDDRHISRRKEETCSYVDANDIIGREEDKEAIISVLLDSNAICENVCFLAIVGVGGLGKTALAQLVFNDEKIKQEFSDRQWVFVSDHGEHFDVKSILCKILGEKHDSSSTLELVQNHFQEKFRGNKYFLVLDDVWNEDRGRWLTLKKFLEMGEEGSRVVITTRSKMTAIIMGDQDSRAYMLKGLSNQDSWRLFQMLAFRGDEEDSDELVKIGKKIVEKCYCVPLAIKVVGSMLFGQEISKWRSLEGSGLEKIGEGDNGILPILKLSYHNLKPSLKSCFSYCAVFPKDYRIKKKKIISLWMAQGYVLVLDGGQNLEDAGEEHFRILLQRCFFQDVERDEYNGVESVKIHDLMHNVAQEVGEEELCIVTSTTKMTGDKIRHVYAGDGCSEISLNKKKIRSYLGCDGHFLDAKINWIRLRALDLSNCNVKNLPDSIGKLLHLRYLDLTNNGQIKVLCEFITELYNLQTLYLNGCYGLMELPKGFSKPVNLRHLDLDRYQLTCMPLGMDKLINLRVLPLFVVGYKSTANKKESGDAMLKDLKALRKIQGSLYIRIGNYCRNSEGFNDNGVGYLKDMDSLRELDIAFYKENEVTVSAEKEFEDVNNDLVEHEAMLGKLEPPPSLKKFVLGGYKGKRIGRSDVNWVVSLPLLVHIEIRRCENLEQMPVLSKLPYLKSLKLIGLQRVEYMENGMRNNSNSSDTELFPSLEYLIIQHLPKLKGWWKEEALRLRFPRLKSLKLDGLQSVEYMENKMSSCSSSRDTELVTEFFPSLVSLVIENLPKLKGWWEGEGPRLRFPRLSVLEIKNCMNLISFAPGVNPELMTENELLCLRSLKIMSCPDMVSDLICPRLEELKLEKTSRRLLITCGNWQNDIIKSREVKIDKVVHLKSLRTNCLTHLWINEDKEVESLSEVKEVFESCASSLRTLRIENCKNLKGLSGLEPLTALEKLTLIHNFKLSICEEDDEEPWKSFHQSLRLLIFSCLPNMISLPKGMQHLTSLQSLQLGLCYNLEGGLPEWINCLSSLQSLKIWDCCSIKSLPEGFRDLTSLKELFIRDCPDLEERCRKPDGEDFPKIQHIPDIILI